MTRTSLSVASMMTVSYLAVHCLGALQEPAATLRVDVKEVPVDVQVFDAAGQNVVSLTRSDFIVFEDGNPQQIQSFFPVQTPRNVLFLLHHASRDAYLKASRDRLLSRGSQLDVGFLWNPLSEFLQGGINRLLAQLRVQDQVRIAAFDLSVQTLLDWQPAATGNLRDVLLNPIKFPQLPAARNPIFAANGHDLYGALLRVSEDLKSVNDLKSVVVFDDGRDIRLDPIMQANERSEGMLDPLFGLPDMQEVSDFERVAEAIRRSGARFYFVAYGTDRNRQLLPEYGLPAALRDDLRNPRVAEEYLQRVRIRLERLAEISGGRVIYPAKTEDLILLTEQIGRELRGSYSLTYSPSKASNDGTYRRIEIRLRDQTMRAAISREGYFAR